MMKKDNVSIGSIYGNMLDSFKNKLHESKTFDGVDSKKLMGKGYNVDGFNKALNDESEEISMDESEETVKSPKRPIRKKSKKMQKEIAESKKIASQILNKHMSKSVFDRLYKNVLKENFGFDQEDDKDLDALGLDDATPDSELDDDFEEGGSDSDGESVTFTLDRETAQKLIEVLQGAMGEDLGDDSDDLDAFDDEDGDDDLDIDFEDGDEDEDESFEEDEEVQGTKPAPDKKGVFQGKNNKVGGKANPRSGKASTDVTDEVGTKDMSHNYNDGKNNKVKSKVTPGDFFK
jgi:hypothetical protein